MAKKHVIDQDSNEPIEINQADSTWIVKQGVTLDAPSGWSVLYNTTKPAKNVDFIVEGEIGGANATMSIGVFTNGKDNSIEITDTGSITGGNFGIATHGKNIEVVNDGTISGWQAGIQFGGENYEFRNSGLITTSDLANGDAIYVSTFFAPGKIVNEVGGTITGLVDAVGGGPMTFINKGTITDIPNAVYEVYLGYGDDRFVNRGTINGSVALGEGNDIADLRKGTTTGNVTGSGGNDIYIVGQNEGWVHEYAGDGIDTLKTMANFDARLTGGEMERFVAIGKAGITIIANEYDNIVTGNRGKNFLDGWAGDDTLRGGKNVDIFNFGSGYDSDRIMDFEDGKDVINVASWNNINDFSDIQAIASVQGDDIVLAFGNEDLTIRNMKMSELDATDFIF